jgi:hypothetical protein
VGILSQSARQTFVDNVNSMSYSRHEEAGETFTATGRSPETVRRGNSANVSSCANVSRGVNELPRGEPRGSRRRRCDTSSVVQLLLRAALGSFLVRPLWDDAALDVTPIPVASDHIKCGAQPAKDRRTLTYLWWLDAPTSAWARKPTLLSRVAGWIAM